MESMGGKVSSSRDANEQYCISDKIKFDSKNFIKMVPEAIMMLDGLWFMNVLETIGLKNTLKIDFTVISTYFKLITRFICNNFGVDGKTITGKAQIFNYLAHLWGHHHAIYTDDHSIVLDINKCGFYEYLKKVGRTDELDCTYICRSITPSWISEIDARTGGKASINLDLPKGGSSCIWRVEQP